MNSKITLSTLKSLGFIKLPFSKTQDVFVNEPTHYPLNQLKLFYIKKSKTIIVQTNNTNYKCTDLKSLISAIYFSGVNYGHTQKQQQIKKILNIQ